MNLMTLCETLQAEIDTKAPATRGEAKKQSADLVQPMAELAEWLTTVQDLVGEVEAAAGELEDAGDGEKRDEAAESRTNAHAQLVEVLIGLRDELVTCVPAPA
jgi:hypothetical protein